jgi:inhibitor of cysteine peptidase
MQKFVDPAGTIHVAVGGTFALALTGNPTTGYTWQLEVDPHHLELLDQSFEPVDGGIGAGGHEVFRLRALADGQTEIACEYRRPWDKEARDTKQLGVMIA